MAKSIFITGAASGIGKATAISFAEKGWNVGLFDICLLYTSDAADEEDSVDLGGRRIIKKNITFSRCVF